MPYTLLLLLFSPRLFLLFNIHLLVMKNILLVIAFFLSFQLSAQSIRGLYVNDFVYIIGNTAAEDELLEFAQQHGFNYLLCYNLYFIHTQKFSITEAESAQPLADFMRRARKDYGIESFGVVGESARSFERLEIYNQLYPDPEARFDVFNLEFEFWNKNMINKYYCNTYLDKNQLPCDTSGAFTYYHQQLLQIKEQATRAGALTEVYIGKPTPGQCKIIGDICDRVLVHYYRSSPLYKNGNSIYNYLSYRLPALAPTQGTLDILPIFGAGPKFMGEWISQNSLTEAYSIYLDGQNAWNPKTEDWKNHINMVGAQWYRYTDMLVDLAYTASTQQLSSEIPTDFIVIPGHIDSQIVIPKTNNGPATLQLLDLSGNIIHQNMDADQNSVKLNMKQIEPGVYFLSLLQETANQHFRIVVQR